MRSDDHVCALSELYGLRGITHGGAKVLTVMSAQGSQTILNTLEAGDNVHVYSGPGRLVQYHEKRAGALAALIRRYRIQVLDKVDWDLKKVELGSTIWN